MKLFSNVLLEKKTIFYFYLFLFLHSLLKNFFKIKPNHANINYAIYLSYSMLFKSHFILKIDNPLYA